LRIGLYGISARELCSLVFEKRITIAKFLASGFTAGCVQFSILYVLKHYGGVHYAISSTLAFIVAVCVGFTLQKFWTFGDPSLTQVHRQAMQYLVLALVNLVINASLMLFMVEVFHVWYIISQVVVCVVLGANNFLMYNLLIFKPQS
jgi:putative flippase GtrA